MTTEDFRVGDTVEWVYHTGTLQTGTVTEVLEYKMIVQRTDKRLMLSLFPSITEVSRGVRHERS